ncbi:CNNM domain-containing protein [Salinimicrobium sp. MT39]|uniref:CNNM domain-containing protein n=1 Tax=Salinimicrobium profundisediminis TaxID=2994553 RepID=A0A9X3D137_9FLAO|nr:CNNM domain-containing protein [Salinimicrobium profundisediminis]MCX2839334.1 CNNM domain-containing protein [Salinimicrobium profundisediminis]
MGLLLTYLFIALFTSFICSIAEAALLSTPVSYVKAKIEMGSRTAKNFLSLKEDVDRPLSAILSLNTVAHTVGAAGVGAQATVVFGEAYFGIVSAVLTILILILTEIIPKTLGANFSKELMGITTKVIRLMIVITYPLVIMSLFLTRFLSRKEKELTTSREEISALASIGTEEGIFADKENKIIQNLIRLKTIRISEIMTPRIVVVLANEEMTLQEFLVNKEFLHFSRIPVYSESRENVTGYVFREMVFEKLAEDQFHLKLKDIRRTISTFAETDTLFSVWEELLHKKEQISLVVDEYGGIDGIVTLEDIIETLLGFEIVDEKDRVEDMQQYAMERWKARQKKYQLLRQDPKKSTE